MNAPPSCRIIVHTLSFLTSEIAMNAGLRMDELRQLPNVEVAVGVPWALVIATAG